MSLTKGSHFLFQIYLIVMFSTMYLFLLCRAGAYGFGVCKTTSHAFLNIQNRMFSILFTDNIFAIKSWAKRKFGFEESRIDKSFGIPEDFDYID